MEKERTGSACRIQNTLLKRRVNDLPTHPFSEPVGRVVVPEVVPLFGIYQGLIEPFEDVLLDVHLVES